MMMGRLVSCELVCMLCIRLNLFMCGILMLDSMIDGSLLLVSFFIVFRLFLVSSMCRFMCLSRCCVMWCIVSELLMIIISGVCGVFLMIGSVGCGDCIRVWVVVRWVWVLVLY